MTTIPLLEKIKQVILNPLIGLLFGLALIYFLWGVAEYLLGADSEERRSAGRQHMFWGVIGLAIMVSVFGILQIICNTIGC